MKKIPLFIFEEHHEAFFVWNYSVMNKIIQASNNVLLHVDEHSDMGVPNFNKSMKFLNSLKALHDFTYTELAITDFIIPALFQGIFNQVYWLYQSNDESKKAKKNIVYSPNGQAKTLKLLKADQIDQLGVLSLYKSKFRNFMFEPITTECQFSDRQSVVLDIDLDYFSCNPSSYYYNQGKLEVTEEEYKSFHENKYHFLRLSFGSSINIKEENGKYYLILSSTEPPVITSKLKVSEEEIIKRIDKLILFLNKNNIEIQMIDICRSRLSGFTPDDQWEFIERKLIEKFSDTYEIEINNIKDIFSQEHLSNVS
jgi:hypothetical protein